ncbi:glycosyltransferase [Bacillus sp. V3-13]|uniref:glycosyltransferase n=1 Tax=Bacillus sp. V3-13 TaxID=2053728 RepID=UPI000C791BBB|nr:glycosyltransferase [Bacillus sp. V3-13]PLR78267.1 glycosyltransferase [Bacillus sp. V3-13]
MKVLHINAGTEDGGGKTHIISLLAEFPKSEVALAVFEEGPVAVEARSLGINVHVLGQKNRYDLSILSRLKSLINKHSYDIVHTHGPRANLFMALIKKRINAKWVSTIHSNPELDFETKSLRGNVFTKLNFFSFKKIDLILAVTEKLKTVLTNKGLIPDNIEVIYNGIHFTEVPSDPVDLTEKYGVPDNHFIIVHVARLHPIKGHEVLFDSLQKVKYKNIKVLLVGDGPLARDLQNLAKTLNITDNVLFLGYQKNVNKIISASNIGILTSHSEGFPIVLLEVANQHKTCITTNVSDVEKLIPDSTFGWIVPVRDSDALSKAIEEAYETWEKGGLPSMGERLFNNAKERFSLDKLYNDVRNSYRRVLSK